MLINDLYFLYLHNIFAYITDIVGERGKQKRILPELLEHRAELPQVFSQKRVRLPLRHGACRIPFPRLQPMSISYIRVMFFRMPALKILRASHRPLEKRQPVDSRLPVRSLMAVCSVRTRNRPPEANRG